MVQKWVDLLQGCAAIEVSGPFPERFLNLCAQNAVEFWALEYPDAHSLRVYIRLRGLKKARKLAEKAMCELTVLKRSGLPVFLYGFRRRYALLLGLAVSLCVVVTLSQYILTVEVQGNERVSTQDILEELRRQGVYPGVYSPTVDEEQISNDALVNLEELIWMSVNLHGTRAQVLVRERVPIPPLVDESVPAHVVAARDGVITHMETTSGQARFQEGNTVAAGDVLISGVVDLQEPKYSQVDMGTLTVRASGKIYARTWHTLQAVIPLEVMVKEYSGAEMSRWSLTFFGQKKHFYKNGGISYAGYDKITNNHTLTLGDGRELPFALTKERVREYSLNPFSVDRDAAEELLRTRLEERLQQLLQSGEGTVVQQEFSCEEKNGLLCVTLVAECREQIGKTVEFEGQVGRSQGMTRLDTQ